VRTNGQEDFRGDRHQIGRVMGAAALLGCSGKVAPPYPTLNRRLSVFAKTRFRQALSQACCAHAALGRASLVLYDVTTLHFETDAGDGFREPGSPRNVAWTRRSPSAAHRRHRVPTVGGAFEGNKAETGRSVHVSQV
jgi:hypothetical protein